MGANSNALTVVDGASLMAIEEREWGRDRIDLYKATVCKGASDLEMAYFLAVARRTGLEPGKQIYSVPYGGARVIQTGIDGYRLIADRTNEYVGSDPPVYTPADGDAPNLCTVTVHRLKDGVARAFSHTARYSEFKRNTDPWRAMPWHMLAIAAERHALKKAFPQELAGIEDGEDATVSAARVAPREIKAPGQPIQIDRPQVGGSSRRQMREMASRMDTQDAPIKAKVTPPYAPEPHAQDEPEGEPVDREALLAELREMAAHGFDLERYLQRKHPDVDLTELSDAELMQAAEIGRNVAKKQ